MARYTVELRELMRNEETMSAITEALSHYPLYVPETVNEKVRSLIPTREELNNKLLRHYRNKEIGSETVGRFLEDLEYTMEEIMPYYNQMYQTVEIMANLPSPFDNVDVIESYQETRDSSGSSSGSTTNDTSSEASTTSDTTSNVDSKSKTLESDFPQGNVSKTASEIDDVTHADKGVWSHTESNDTASSSGTSSTSASGTTTSEGTSSNTETIEHTFTKKGNQGVNTYAHDMLEYRDTLIDVTMMIIQDKRVAELFMLVY